MSAALLGQAFKADMGTRSEERCFYCGDPIADRLHARHFDHKQPLSRGGSNGSENRALACSNCNCRKGVQTVEEFRIFLMLRDGRPPTPFFGEQTKPRRDWLICIDPLGPPPKRREQGFIKGEPRRRAKALGLERRLDTIRQYLGDA